MFDIKDLHKSFGALEMLNGISIDVMKGQIVCVIGTSGSSKSAIIPCTNALSPVTSASINVEGLEVHGSKLNKLELRKRVRMALQEYNLFPPKTAIQNIIVAPNRVLNGDQGVPGHCSAMLGSGIRRIDIQANFPAVSSSASPSRSL